MHLHLLAPGPLWTSRQATERNGQKQALRSSKRKVHDGRRDDGQVNRDFVAPRKLASADSPALVLEIPQPM